MTELDYFRSFLMDEVLDMIVYHTNLHAVMSPEKNGT